MQIELSEYFHALARFSSDDPSRISNQILKATCPYANIRNLKKYANPDYESSTTLIVTIHIWLMNDTAGPYFNCIINTY